MGVRLEQLYEEARLLGGIKAQMRLAMLTGLPRHKAAAAEDHPASVKKLENALMRIKKEM